MITRPLDLASKLRPEPRNFDFLFLVNGGLIVLFFSLSGSRFILAPGLGVDFQLPQMPGSAVGAAQTTHHLSVKQGGMLFVADQGQITLERLRGWLKEKSKGTRQPVLLIRADKGVETSVLTEIATAAAEAGFKMVFAVDPVRTVPDQPN